MTVGSVSELVLAVKAGVCDFSVTSHVPNFRDYIFIAGLMDKTKKSLVIREPQGKWSIEFIEQKFGKKFAILS
jgi:hypothetical protein